LKKWTGDDGDIDDIAKNVNIAMQNFKLDTIRRNEHRKNELAQMALLVLWRAKVPKVSKVPEQILKPDGIRRKGRRKIGMISRTIDIRAA
jgi:hypothetical protein